MESTMVTFAVVWELTSGTASWNRIEGYSTQMTSTDWSLYQVTQEAPANAAHATVWSWKGGR